MHLDGFVIHINGPKTAHALGPIVNGVYEPVVLDCLASPDNLSL
jgi:hypothetical protein